MSDSDVKSEKAFGKYHDIALLILGFALTTGMGTIITKCAQDRSWDRQQEVLATKAAADRLAEERSKQSAALTALAREEELRGRDSAAAKAAEEAERRYTDALNVSQQRWELFLQDREQSATIRTKQLELRQAERLDSLGRQEAHRIAATQVFDEVSRAADKRIYRWWRLYSSISRGEAADTVALYRREHREAMYEWNESLNRNRALICRYFGYNHAWAFENNIQRGFRAITEGITPHLQAYPEQSSPNLSELERAANELHQHVYNFDNTLVEMLRLNRIGIEETDGCSTLIKNPEAFRTSLETSG